MKDEKQIQDLQKKYLDLYDKYNELIVKYGKMSRDIAEIQMKLEGAKRIENRSAEQKKRDKTLYKFNGRIMNKRDLVLECVIQYMVDNHITKSHEILSTFPDYIQGPLGVIRSVDEISERYSDPNNRYFFEESERLKLEDGSFAVSKDWNVSNIGAFLKVAESLGYGIIPIMR